MPRTTRPKAAARRIAKTSSPVPTAATIRRVPPTRYLAISGSGRPGGEEFQEKVAVLYGVAYTIKFAEKAQGRDFKVAKLEGTFQFEAGPEGYQPGRSVAWRLLVEVPSTVRSPALRQAAQRLLARGKTGPFGEVALFSMGEGTCVEMLHVGPYSQEHSTINAMLACAREGGFEPAGNHHEIYLSDPTRVPAEKLRTVLRLPLRKTVRAAP
jgi:hypothetical protein